MGTKPDIFTADKELSIEDIDYLLENIDKLDEEEALQLSSELEELERREYAASCRNDFITFIKHMESGYKVGAHHKHLSRLLQEVEEGKKDRITVSIAPRHGKSHMTSTYFPAWYLGRNPDHKMMLVSHTADLAVDFGRKVRNLINSEKYREVFPGVSLAADSKSAGRWNTNHGGEFYATGVGSSLAGRGAHMLVIDDPHSEQDVLAGNFEVFEKAYQWFTFGARTRLMPGGRVAIVATRWHQADLIGRLLKDMVLNPKADQYEPVEFPAILNENTPEEKALWPGFFDLEALHRTKASMPLFQWNAQYQQNPTGETSAVIKKEWWNMWEKEKPPQCEYIIMTLDAAAELNNRADFTSIETWGVWHNEETDRYEIILLNAIKKRLEFPELKEAAYDAYTFWEPDAFIVEKKSSGTPLYQEMRRSGILVQEYTPVRGTTNNPNNKMARVNAVADILRSGLVWAPMTRWAEDVIEECAAFPFGQHDDQVDTMVMALARFRQGGFIKLPSDEMDEPSYRRRHGGYY